MNESDKDHPTNKRKQSKQHQTKKDNSSSKKSINLNVTYNIINNNDHKTIIYLHSYFYHVIHTLISSFVAK